MLYAILCYNSEAITSAWTKEEDDAVMARLDVVHRKLADQGRLGPTAQAFTFRIRVEAKAVVQFGLDGFDDFW